MFFFCSVLQFSFLHISKFGRYDCSHIEHVHPIFCAHLIIIFGVLNLYIFTSTPPLECLHGLFGPYTLIFLIHRTLLMSIGCDACNISAIGEANDKNQPAIFFSKILRTPDMVCRKERDSEYS